MAAKKLRRARLSQELCERLSRHQITTCQVKGLFYTCGAEVSGGVGCLSGFGFYFCVCFRACTVYFFEV